jgi:2-polyprenyl-3-methyl-5-hydroxy-6-metoxy-1,4-benzoquinol methylase
LIDAVPADATVLDVGCGSGLLLGLLAARRKIRSGYGFDASAEAIRLAAVMKEQLGQAGTLLTFEHRNVADPWPADDFDLVGLIDVLHHVPPARQHELIRLACARVRKGGVLLYKDMVRRPWWQAWANRMHDLVLAHQWIYYVPVERVRTWVLGCGFREERYLLTRQLWYGHELCVFRRLQGD